MTRKMFLSMAFLAATTIGMQAAIYKIDTAHSAVNFSVSHLKLSTVDGSFKQFEGTIDYDSGKLNVLEGKVAISSIDTQNQDRDSHLNKPDMFDSAKYPYITFKMTKFENNKIYGDLTIKETTKAIVLDSKIAESGNNITIEGSTVIKRSEFGISWENVFQDNAVGDDVNINISLKASR